MEDVPPSRGPGRPPHQPTDELRARVLDLVAQDADVDTIAAAVGVSEPTLREHYQEELAAPRPQQTFPFPGFSDPVERAARAHGGGRPAHEPTAESREMVEILAGSKVKAWEIADALGISEPTLREHYAQELRFGRAKKKAAMLVSQYRAGVEGNVSAQKAWLGQSHAVEQAPPAEKAPPAEAMGKKEAAQQAALAAGTGKYATPPPPLKLVSSNS